MSPHMASSPTACRRTPGARERWDEDELTGRRPRLARVDAMETSGDGAFEDRAARGLVAPGGP
jgi:hypothetical protein